MDEEMATLPSLTFSFLFWLWYMISDLLKELWTQLPTV
jgi:hypothetical protein